MLLMEEQHLPDLSSRLRLKCDGTRAETRFRLSAKRTSPFKSAEASVQSTTGSQGVRISGSNVGYTMFRGSVKSIGYPLHSPVSPSLPLPCVTVCHHISTGLYCPRVRTGLLPQVFQRNKLVCGALTNFVRGGEGQQIQLRTGAVAPWSGILEAAVIWYKKFHFIQ